MRAICYTSIIMFCQYRVAYSRHPGSQRITVRPALARNEKIKIVVSRDLCEFPEGFYDSLVDIRGRQGGVFHPSTPPFRNLIDMLKQGFNIVPVFLFQL